MNTEKQNKLLKSLPRSYRYRSVNELEYLAKDLRKGWPLGLSQFIDQYDVEIKKGRLVLYKAVRTDYSANWRKRKVGAYKIGNIVINSRGANQNRHQLCGYGLHAGTYKCARFFGQKFIANYNSTQSFHIIEVLIDPKDVVCVPFYAVHTSTPAYQKLRCKKLYVSSLVEEICGNIDEHVDGF